MTGFIVSVFPFRNRVSPNEAFEGLELGEGKLSRPVLRRPGGRKAAWLLGNIGTSHRFSDHDLSSACAVPVFDRSESTLSIEIEMPHPILNWFPALSLAASLFISSLPKILISPLAKKNGISTTNNEQHGSVIPRVRYRFGEAHRKRLRIIVKHGT
jgi:hypothetical protein